MSALIKIVENFVSFKRIPLKIVMITVFTSNALLAGAWVMGQPLYIIALLALLPWVPVLLFESLWKVDHYHFIAVFAVITVLQVGHLGEHLTQVGALSLTTGTLACPPPVDNDLHFNRAVEAGLRSDTEKPTYYSSSTIVVPDKPNGEATLDADGEYVSGPPACGVFGQLDLEIVHLVWEILGWFLTLWILQKYPKNIWLWIAIFWLSVHTVEHLFISYTFFLSPEELYTGARQLWATIADGVNVTAIPITKEPAIVNFYSVAGKFGIVSRNGIIGTFFPGLNSSLPTRPWLHFGYNTLITIPMVIAFILEMRKIYDYYLAEALPMLTKKELITTTPALARHLYHKGDIIIKQGDIGDLFHIISKGEVEVIHEEDDGTETHIATLGHGKYFGEIGLMSENHRIATVRALSETVETMSLNRETFVSLMDSSEMSRVDVLGVMDRRIHDTEEQSQHHND